MGEDHNQAKETVILVHGTFAAPERDGPPQWYEPGHPFATALDARLEALGSRARCWAHLRDRSDPRPHVFSWDGSNSWISRISAAKQLAALLQSLRSSGWICHVVAHSHGGNVLLDAIFRSERRTIMGTWVNPDYRSTFVLLGTPIFNVESRSRRDDRVRGFTIPNLALFLVVPVVVWLVAESSLRSGVWAFYRSWWWLLALLFLIGAGLMFLNQFIASLFKTGVAPDDVKYEDNFLTISSPHDEAWLLFDNLSKIHYDPTPPRRAAKAPRFAWARAIGQAIEEQDQIEFPSRHHPVAYLSSFLFALCLVLLVAAPVLRQWDAISAAIIAPSAFVLFCLFIFFPREMLAGGSLLRRVYLSLKLVVQSLMSSVVVSFVMRHWWGVFRAFAYGFGGHPQPSFDVSRKIFGVHIDLPNPVLTQVLHTRSVTLGDTWNRLYSVLTDPSRHPDVDQLLAEVEQSPSLVHAAYYSNRHCIDWIATWIARTDLQSRPFPIQEGSSWPSVATPEVTADEDVRSV